VKPEGLVDKTYALWNRNSIVVPSLYLESNGLKARPTPSNVPTY
jgi:hypothetical protein